MDFDLISDLHIDQWPKDKMINFKGLGTSLTCIVAGDISKELTTTRDFLYQLADNYKQVIFVDGNHEHKIDYSLIPQNCEWLDNELTKKSNITFLYDSTCIFGSTAIVGSNGWWTFDYTEPTVSRLDNINDFCAMENCSHKTAIGIWDEAVENSEFLCNVVSDFNSTDIIKEIVLITHTVPHKDLISPMHYMSNYDLSKTYNSNMKDVLSFDTNKKISTWCFGHYHTLACDEVINGVRYISNPRGRPDDTMYTNYYPKLVKL